jgi:hypothetical protein
LNIVHLLYLFMATYGSVFFLGLQSLTVNSGHRALAFFNSLMIGCMSLFLYKTVPNVQSIAEVLVYLFAGPLAILTSMAVHGRIKARLTRGNKPAANKLSIEIEVDPAPAIAAIGKVKNAMQDLELEFGRFGEGRYGPR